MTEQEALGQASGYVSVPANSKFAPALYKGHGRLIGYFPFEAANHLVGTGKYKFHQSNWCGYVLEETP